MIQFLRIPPSFLTRSPQTKAGTTTLAAYSKSGPHRTRVPSRTFSTGLFFLRAYPLQSSTALMVVALHLSPAKSDNATGNHSGVIWGKLAPRGELAGAIGWEACPGTGQDSWFGDIKVPGSVVETTRPRRTRILADRGDTPHLITLWPSSLFASSLQTCYAQGNPRHRPQCPPKSPPRQLPMTSPPTT